MDKFLKIKKVVEKLDKSQFTLQNKENMIDEVFHHDDVHENQRQSGNEICKEQAVQCRIHVSETWEKKLEKH